jgi:large subunit ribosomal protein L19e
MNTSYQKRLASRILKISPKRVKVAVDKDAGEALTRNDVKHLIVKGVITKKPKKGNSRVKANYIAGQKKKGRRKGRGKRSGTRHAVGTRKDDWMKTIRALRKLLKELKDNGQVSTEVYGKMYRKAKGGEFRNRKHMLSYLKDNDLLLADKRGVKIAKG